MYKKLIAKRKLHCKCDYCNKTINKGEVYYKERIIKTYFDYENNKSKIYGYNLYECPKCKYKGEQHFKRYLKFQKKCTHPEKFIETEYDYIPGECVKEPKYDYCRLCGKIL